MGFGARGLRSGVQGLGLGARGLRFGVQGLGFVVQGVGVRFFWIMYRFGV